MNAWVVRAVVLGALVTVFRMLLGYAMLAWPTNSGWLRPVLFAVVLLAALLWGVSDGRRDRDNAAVPEGDLTKAWLWSAFTAALGSGLASWLLGFLPSVQVGSNSLVFELTSGASFIVLILLIPGMVGVAIGRRGSDRTPTAS